MTNRESNKEAGMASKLERDMQDAIIRRLVSLTVGSCSCLTMSPELKYHTATCRYRIAAEALELARPLFTSPQQETEGREITEAMVERHSREFLTYGAAALWSKAERDAFSRRLLSAALAGGQ